MKKVLYAVLVSLGFSGFVELGAMWRRLKNAFSRVSGLGGVGENRVSPAVNQDVDDLVNCILQELEKKNPLSLGMLRREYLWHRENDTQCKGKVIPPGFMRRLDSLLKRIRQGWEFFHHQIEDRYVFVKKVPVLFTGWTEDNMVDKFTDDNSQSPEEKQMFMRDQEFSLMKFIIEKFRLGGVIRVEWIINRCEPGDIKFVLFIRKEDLWRGLPYFNLVVRESTKNKESTPKRARESLELPVSEKQEES